MRIRFMSDLHLEFTESWNHGFVPPQVEADVHVLAGDIHTGTQALPWIRDHFTGTKVIYICGNHEGYHHDLWKVKEELKEATKDSDDIRFLDNEWTLIDGVWFFGGTLWTDYALDNNVPTAKRVAAWAMNDHRLVQYCGTMFTPDIAEVEHGRAVLQIARGLDGFDGKKVIVTHHLPSAKSIDKEYVGSALNPAYASDLEHLMKGPEAPALWIHGHTHRSRDYQCHDTRVVCNPRGYPSGKGKNWGFEPTKVVEV